MTSLKIASDNLEMASDFKSKRPLIFCHQNTEIMKCTSNQHLKSNILISKLIKFALVELSKIDLNVIILILMNNCFYRIFHDKSDDPVCTIFSYKNNKVFSKILGGFCFCFYFVSCSNLICF